MNELINSNEQSCSKKWFTIDELAEWTGISIETLKGGHSPLNELSIGIKAETRLGGYHNTQKFYSENVLKALKEYQIKNGSSNALKNKDTVIAGNVSYIENKTFAQTINGLLDNPEALLTLINESSKRIAALQQRVTVAENTLNRISDGKGCYSMNITAKALKLPFGNKTLFEKLRAMKILNQDNSPKQDQINSGHFKVIVKHINDSIGSKPVTLVTGKGLVYLAKKFNTEIDESVLSENINV